MQCSFRGYFLFHTQMRSVVRLGIKFKARCSISSTVTTEIVKLSQMNQFMPTHSWFFYVRYTGRLNGQSM